MFGKNMVLSSSFSSSFSPSFSPSFSSDTVPSYTDLGLNSVKAENEENVQFNEINTECNQKSEIKHTVDAVLEKEKEKTKEKEKEKEKDIFDQIEVCEQYS
jgi:hypothetical protein